MRRLILLAAILLAALAGCGSTSPRDTQPQHFTPFGVSPHAPGFGRPAPITARLNPALAATRTVEMFDSITLDTLPSNPVRLAGYTAGHWRTFAPMVARYGRQRVKSIAIFASLHADCLDVESGDATPDQVVAWIRSVRADHGIHLLAGRACVYSSFYEWRDQIAPLLRAAGIPRSWYWAWDASYTFRPGVDFGFDGTQWTDRAYGRNLDESTITTAFAGIIAPKPKPRPVPRPAPCFGPRYHHQPACTPVRRRVAAETRQIVQTRRTLTARGCWQHPHRPGCQRLRAQGNSLHHQITLQLRSRA